MEMDPAKCERGSLVISFRGLPGACKIHECDTCCVFADQKIASGISR